MKMSMNCKFLGTEDRLKKDGGTYTVMGLLQGFQAEELFVNENLKEMIVPLKPNTDCHVVANVVINGEHSRISILEITPINHNQGK